MTFRKISGYTISVHADVNIAPLTNQKLLLSDIFVLEDYAIQRHILSVIVSPIKLLTNKMDLMKKHAAFLDN